MAKYGNPSEGSQVGAKVNRHLAADTGSRETVFPTSGMKPDKKHCGVKPGAPYSKGRAGNSGSMDY